MGACLVSWNKISSDPTKLVRLLMTHLISRLLKHPLHVKLQMFVLLKGSVQKAFNIVSKAIAPFKIFYS